ncbi:MAG: PEP-CTERM sorting domain-containing protein [Verrucomicrobiota bacterium JB022]|nr:PEP-CTERM sorting domain-containing protein [Verrucomicrobiota bacterium JB022]
MKLAFSLAALAALAPIVTAQNFSYEMGLDGWTTGGNAYQESAASFGPSATDGDFYAVIDSGDRPLNNDFFNPTTNPTGVSADDLTSLVGQDKASLDSAFGIDSFDISYLAFEFTVTAGDVISFDWKFLTNEFPGTEILDTAFVATSQGDLISLANVDTATYLDFPDAVMSFETGWTRSSITAQTSGSLTVLFGIADDFSTDMGSALALDNVTVTPVPEPSTYAALAGLGVLGLVALRRRRA